MRDVYYRIDSMNCAGVENLLAGSCCDGRGWGGRTYNRMKKKRERGSVDEILCVRWTLGRELGRIGSTVVTRRWVSNQLSDFD